MLSGLDNPIHILLVLVIVLLVFGAKRVPELGRSLGSGLREFKDSLTGVDQPRLQPPVPGQGERPTGSAVSDADRYGGPALGERDRLGGRSDAV